MFKSKILLKFILLLFLLLVGYGVSIYIFILPQTTYSIEKLEEDKANEVLSKVKIIVQNVSNDLESFKKTSLQQHKDELKNLTDTVWSIIQKKYEESKPQTLEMILENRGERLKKNLMEFYNKNRDKLTTTQMKEAIKNYTKIYRDNSLNRGYFWINNSHNKNQKLGIVKYKSLNPNSNLMEDKISYLFIFEPFGWVFGTDEYYSVLTKKFKNEVINIVNKIRYQNDNYFYISDYNSIIISHPYLQDKDFSKVRDKKGNLIIPPMVKIAREKGEGFYSYWWKKNKKDNTPYQKLTFAKDFPNWKMVIGTGVYIDDIDREVNRRKKELMSQLQNIIKNTKIGKTGYLYIFDDKANMIIHPNSNINGKNFKNLKNPTKNSYIFDDLVKAYKDGKKVLYYKWDRPNDKGNYIYNKVSWIEYLPKLNWYIVSSAYVDEFKESSNILKNKIFIITMFLFIISLIIGIFLIKRIISPLTKLSTITKDIADGNYHKRVEVTTDDEIAYLARDFNKMIDSVEDFIDNLDKKVQNRTKTIQEQKKELELIHKNTKDSIEFASLIQFALIPEKSIMDKYFEDSFNIWYPKDIVGGDIYLFEELRNENEALLMVIDCTGHGVPGAFVTMLVKAMEREIIAQINKNDYNVSPAIILQYFNKTMKKLLKQDNNDMFLNVGFDAGIIYIDKINKLIKFAGANIPLYYIQDKTLHRLKPNRKSIGYKKSNIDYQFDEYSINIDRETYIYITTDGYIDQTGGEKGLVFGKKRFLQIIEEIYTLPFNQQKDILLDRLKIYQGNSIRRDDITMIGFKVIL